MSTVTTPTHGLPESDERGQAVIDLDIHEMLPGVRALLPYLDDHWARYITDYNWPGVQTSWPYAVPTPRGAFRADAYPEDGQAAGSDLGLLQRQHLELHDVEVGICTGVMYASSMQGWPEFASALASAYNDWNIENWLEKEPRLRGSVQVAHQDPVAAAREIDRVGAHPQMVQVFVHTVTEGHKPLGSPYYRPIFDAIERNDLVLAMHQGQATKTVYGYTNTFAEWHMAVPHASMSQLYGLIFNGIFDQYPNLRLVLLESGFSWLPHALWRMDEHYRAFRVETPWLKQLPSEHVHERVRVSTQPREDITKEQFLGLVEMMGSDELIVYSSDYPHFDFDPPDRVLPPGLPPELARKILYHNAKSLYRF